MAAPPFTLQFTREAESVLQDLRSRKQYAAKFAKVKKALRLLADNPKHPGLRSHAYKSVPGPGGATLWDSYVENNTPGAWRIFWCYGPDTDSITVVTVGPHPD